MMLEPEDFTLPLEKELRLRVIKKEVDECSDVNVLRENLKNCAESLMKFQHLSAKLAEKQMHLLMADFLDTLGVEVPNENNGNSR